MSYLDEYKKALEEERKKEEEKKKQAEKEAARLKAEAEKRKTSSDSDIAPEGRTWFQKGGKTTGSKILGTSTDVGTDLTSGIVGLGEKIVDWAAGLAPAAAKTMYYQNGGGFNIEADKAFEESNKKFEEDMIAPFVAKDLYDEQKVAKTILSNLYAGADNFQKLQSGQMLTEEELIAQQQKQKEMLQYMDESMEADSVLGDKSDSLIQSAGQLLGTSALAVAGVPWYLTTGASTWGAESENALKQGATLGEANLSGMISAGAEILTEKISGGIKIPGLGKTADDAIINTLAANISNKTVRTLAKLGVDMVGEGAEEVLSGVLSAIGQKLTYADDKAFNELFSTEDALESFIGGMVLGGGGSVTSSVQSAIEGVDSVSGLTNDEYKVAQKQLEKFSEGKELTAKEKADEWKKITEKMEKGYISAEDVEEALGGEAYENFRGEWDKFRSSDDYKTYSDVNKKLEALKTEHDTVGSKTEATLIEKARFDDIRREMSDLETKRGELDKTLSQEADRIRGIRDQMRSQVMEQVKDTKLAESYQELARKQQKFEVDVNQYEGKARETVQKIIDSGLGDNTNQFHDAVDFLAKISSDKDVTFDFTNNERIKGTEHHQEGYVTNGYVNDNGDVVLNMDSENAMYTIVGHEVTHVLEKANGYTALQSAVRDYCIAKEGLEKYNARIKAAEEAYKGKKNTTPEGEVTADLIGEYIFNDPDFVKQLSTDDRSTFEKIYDEIKYLFKVAVSGSKEKRELEKVKKVFDDVWRENVKGKPEATKKSEATIDPENDSDLDYESPVKYSVTVTDQDTIDFLENQEHITTYKAMVLIDGKLYPPMASKVKGEDGKYHMTNPRELGEWMQAEEDTTNIKFNDKGIGYYDLKKDDGGTVRAAYNPYEHSSNLVLNDQFEAAYKRDNLVTVECVIPVSEMDAPYKAEYAKDSTGVMDWHSGVVAGKLTDNKRSVYLSRYLKATRILSDAEVAQKYKEIVGDLAVPFNVVSPGLLTELEKVGVNIDYDGSPQYQYLQRKAADREAKKNTKYSLTKDSEGRDLSTAILKRFGNSKVVDENGNLKAVFHGTASGEFFVFDKSKGSVEGDFGSGFYFTDNANDVENNYEGGGPDFENKVARLAEQIEGEEDIDYEEAEQRARAELYKGSHKFEVYLNIENPAIVGKTILFDPDSYFSQYSEEDYDSYEDYEGDVEQLVTDDVDNIILEIERNVDIYSTDGIAEILYEAFNDGGIGLEELKAKLNNLYLEDSNGNLVSNEVARQIVESLGYDGIIDPTVSGKWNMKMDAGTTHYIVFKPNQIKSVTNENPTDNPDIRYSLSPEGQKPGYGYVPSRDIGANDPLDDFAPIREDVSENIAPDVETEAHPINVERPTTRKAYHSSIIDSIKATFSENGYDFDDVLKKAKNLSTWATVDNTPQRVMEKALGYKEGGVLADLTVNKVAQNETNGIKWLNTITDRKNGLLAQLSKEYHIKPGSKESAAAQMYAEGFYVAENNEIISYGDRELAIDFPDINVQRNIKGLAKDGRIRKFYDDTLAMINESRTRNLYPEIPRLDNYHLHFRAMDDTFSRLGLPFNPNDIRAKDLPTDLNGVTADLKPGQPYFASAKHREGKRTSFDILGGLERYASSAKNQIYHIDDIQNFRALRNYLADTYGQANGLEGLDALSEEEAQERIKEVYNSHLSTFAKFLNEEANVLAGKTALIDRGLEGIIGRRGITFLDTINRQVGSNQVGYSVRSALTNFDAIPRAFVKANKADFVKAFGQMVTNMVTRQNDSFAENSPVIIRRKGADRFARTLWQKMSDPGYAMMSAVDNISTELIARAKYNELTRKGMDSQAAHFETDKWVSRLMGDRSLGQQPQLFNSKMLGLLTKYQLEVRNNLDSMFYDSIQEAKVSNEHIQNNLERNAKTAAKATATIAGLAVAQHLFGQAFESVAGYNPSFDIIEAIIKAFGWDDDEEEPVLDNLEEAFLTFVEDMPYTSTFTGGRIPISSALPISELIKGVDQYGNEKSRWETAAETLPYYLLPSGYGQIKKTAEGLDMYLGDHPIDGSYTDSGKLRFPVDDGILDVAQAALFGQYSSKNARDYFDNEWSPLGDKQIEEYSDLDMAIEQYQRIREDLKDFKTNAEKVDYIGNLDITDEQKNVLVNNILDRKDPVDMTSYGEYGSYEEFDFAQKNPGKYAISKMYGYDKYTAYADAISDISSTKDSNGKTISGSRKSKVAAYINSLPLSKEEKMLLFKAEYPADDSYNMEILQWLDSMDMPFSEAQTILEELGFKVYNGMVTWD